MRAKNLISPILRDNDYPNSLVVSPETSLPELLSAIRLSPDGSLKVNDGEKTLGIIDSQTLLTALSIFYMGGDECAFLEGECIPSDYSASLISRAVEDVDAHLLGLWTHNDGSGKMKFTLKVGCSEPMSVAHSLRRYDYDITDWYVCGEKEYQLSEKALDALKLFLKV